MLGMQTRTEATLNIGLDNNWMAQKSLADAAEWLVSFLRNDILPCTLCEVGYVATGQEPTLVVSFYTDNDREKMRKTVWSLAHALGQEAIAWRLDYQPGELTGPHAARWGKFQAALFYHLDECETKTAELCHPVDTEEAA